jgi:hypothetical protein
MILDTDEKGLLYESLDPDSFHESDIGMNLNEIIHVKELSM